MSSTHVRIFNLKSEHKLETLSGAQAAKYGNTECEVFKGGIENHIGFWLKINIPKGNCLTL